MATLHDVRMYNFTLACQPQSRFTPSNRLRLPNITIILFTFSKTSLTLSQNFFLSFWILGIFWTPHIWRYPLRQKVEFTIFPLSPPSTSRYVYHTSLASNRDHVCQTSLEFMVMQNFFDHCFISIHAIYFTGNHKMVYSYYKIHLLTVFHLFLT